MRNPLFNDALSPESAIAGNGGQQRISDLMDKINRQGDQLDSLSKNLAYTGRVPLTITWNGTGNSSELTFQTTFQHNLGYAPGFIGFYNFASETKWYPCDDTRVNSSGSPTFDTLLWSDNNVVGAQLDVWPAAPAAAVTVNFMIYMLTQPAQTTSS